MYSILLQAFHSDVDADDIITSSYILLLLWDTPFDVTTVLCVLSFQDQRKLGVIAASAGNHALALAYHCHLLDIPCTVVTPVTAPIMKVCPALLNICIATL